jgi:hypothetical protein
LNTKKERRKKGIWKRSKGGRKSYQISSCITKYLIEVVEISLWTKIIISCEIFEKK